MVGLAALLGAACLVVFCLGTAGGTLFWLRRSAAEESRPGQASAPAAQPPTAGLIPTRTARPALVTPPEPATPSPSLPAPTLAGPVTPIPNPAEPATPLVTQVGSGALPPTQPSGPEATPGALYGPEAAGLGCLTWNAAVERGQVRQVVDGNTLEVELGGEVRQVRYIGTRLLDFSADPSVWLRSTEKNQQLAGGKTVFLYRDIENEDADGRLLRYVLAGGKLLNYEIIAAGYANAESVPPNTRCDELLLSAEQRALAGSLGLWQPTPTATRTLIPLPSATIAATGNMTITLVARRGTAWQEPDEFVEIRNDSGGPIDLQDWTLQDNERHVFVFPHFVLGAGQYCRVYTNHYRPASCGFSYNSGSPIWDNVEDCAYLKDSLGVLVSKFCYGFQ